MGAKNKLMLIERWEVDTTLIVSCDDAAMSITRRPMPIQCL